jgi:hypothetical protein
VLDLGVVFELPQSIQDDSSRHVLNDDAKGF